MENYEYSLNWKDGGNRFKEISIHNKLRKICNGKTTIETEKDPVMTFHLDCNWQRAPEKEEQIYLILYEENSIYIGETKSPQKRRGVHKWQGRLKNSKSVLLVIPGKKERDLRNMELLMMEETEKLARANNIKWKREHGNKGNPGEPTENFKDHLKPCFKRFFPVLFSFVTRHLRSLPPQPSILVPNAGWRGIKLKHFSPPDYQLKLLIEPHKHRKVKLLKNSCFELKPEEHDYDQETEKRMKIVEEKYPKLREEQKITLDPSTWNGEAQPQTVIKIKVLEDIEFPSLNALICFLRYTASVGKKWKDF